MDQQFYRFLSNFFELHSEFKAEGGKSSRPIFFTGESHAGHYIPSMVAYILGQNEAVVAEGKVRGQAGAFAAGLGQEIARGQEVARVDRSALFVVLLYCGEAVKRSLCGGTFCSEAAT